MTEQNLEELRFPIGRFVKPAEYDGNSIFNAIQEIYSFPKQLDQAVRKLSRPKLENRYRPQGLTIRQVVHHCADSHMNGYIRHKLTLTEDSPVIKPYLQELWSDLNDAKKGAIIPTLQLLQGLHFRWGDLLSRVEEAGMSRAYIHPEQNREIPLFESIALYAWHGNHHLAHVQNALKNGF